jgi:tetratricopeptide (TPR) repeat protein
LAQNATWRHEYSVAIPNVNAAIKIYISHGYLRGQARAKWLIGVISLERRLDYADAEEKVADAAFAFRHLGDSVGEANCLRILGRLSFQTGKFSDAIKQLQSAMTLYHKVKWVYGEADCNQAHGEILLARRDTAASAMQFRKAIALYSELGHLGGKIFCTRAFGDIAVIEEDYAKAKDLYDQTYNMSTSDVDKARAEFGLARLLLIIGDNIQAREIFNRILPVFQKHSDAVLEEAYVLKRLGDLSVDAGDYNSAMEYCEQALAAFRLMQVLPAQADCLSDLAKIAQCQLHRETALEGYKEALMLYQRVDDDERMKMCSTAIQGLT